MRKRYRSDISREQFERIGEVLESARKRTRPRTVDLYDVLCAILYLLKSGCQWSMLPSDFPPKSTVYHYFKLWKEKSSEGQPSLLERALKKGGWHGPTQQWTERFAHIADCGCAARQKHGYG